LTENRRTVSDDDLRCSFCQKSSAMVGKLISSPVAYQRVYICDECVMVCHSILEDTPPVARVGHPSRGASAMVKELHQLVDLIPESDQETVQKILDALTRPRYGGRNPITTMEC
jgi:ATP-dependent protease Clp ATPase subunit